jgi:hypothetical protein
MLRARAKIISTFIHPGFRPSSPAPGVAKSSKELAIPPVLPPPERTNLAQIRAPKMWKLFLREPLGRGALPPYRQSAIEKDSVAANGANKCIKGLK